MLLIVVGTLRVPSLLKKGEKNFTHPKVNLVLTFHEKHGNLSAVLVYQNKLVSNEEYSYEIRCLF